MTTPILVDPRSRPSGPSGAPEPTATRSGRRRDRRRATAPLSLLATTGLLLTTLATVYGFCRIFPDWAYFPRLALLAVAVHAICLVGRYRGWSLAVVGAVTIVVTAVLLGMIFLPDTMTAGILPSRATWDGAWQQLADAWSLFRVTVTPVPSDGGYGITLALATAAIAFLSDGFAFRAFGRAEAVIPAGLLFVVTSSLGYDRLRLTSSAIWLIAALSAVMLLRAAHNETSVPWLGGGGPSRRVIGLGGAALAAGVVAALAAVIVGPSLPGADAEPLVSTHQRSGSGTEVVSPLVDVQARLVNRENQELFTVQASEARYWRLTSLESFDGRQWRQKRSYKDADVLGAVDSSELVQTYTIATLGSIWLPAALTPTGVQSTVRVRFNAELASLIRARGSLFTGLEYTVSSRPPVITPEQLDTSSSANPPATDYTDLPDEFPNELRDLAAQLTAGSSNDYAKALALQNYFRDNFTYNVNVPRGHSDRAMESFIRGREGYCEQFAGTFAALGRAVGLATRVAVGFTPGDVDDAGVFHVRGKHAHAWPEVWFDGIGWVPFEPTPGRGDGSATSYTGVPAGQAGGTLTEPADTNTSGGTATADDRENGTGATGTAPNAGANPLNPDGLDGTAGTPTTAVAPTLPADATGESTGGVPAAVVVLLVLVGLAALWVLVMPPIVRALRAGRVQAPAEQVLAAWRDAELALGAAGSGRRPEETAHEFAERAWRMTGCDRAGVRRLAELADVAAYSPSAPTDAMVDEATELARQVVEILNRRTSWWQRVTRRIDPRLAPIA